MSQGPKPSCCDPFAVALGMPRDFVRSMWPEPAQSFAEYISQYDALGNALERAEACSHYRFHAFEQLSYIRNEDFDNRIWRAEKATVEYCGMSVAEYLRTQHQ